MFLSIHLNYKTNNNKIIYYTNNENYKGSFKAKQKNYKGNVVYVTRYVYCNHFFFCQGILPSSLNENYKSILFT